MTMTMMTFNKASVVSCVPNESTVHKYHNLDNCLPALPNLASKYPKIYKNFSILLEWCSFTDQMV